MVLEICAYSISAAQMALDAGADRVELCAAPESDGVSPPFEWIAELPLEHQSRLAVMLRPRAGDFVYQRNELDTMETELNRLCTQTPVQALVFGVLNTDGTVNAGACAHLVRAARNKNKQSVFHRAIEQTLNPFKALETIIECGFDRVLCGFEISLLLELRELAAGRIVIMPGGGVRSYNAMQYLQLGFTEIHSSARSPESGHLPDICELKALIDLVKP
jgi:copper homeostasis protein